MYAKAWKRVFLVINAGTDDAMISGLNPDTERTCASNLYYIFGLHGCMSSSTKIELANIACVMTNILSNTNKNQAYTDRGIRIHLGSGMLMTRLATSD